MRHGATAVAVPGGASTAPLVVAHRGAWGIAPQNSLRALEDGIAIGCDAIEIDVRRTADGRLVLVHDARVRLRTVNRLEHHQVQARMKVGQAPLLEDVLRRAAGRILVDIELKEDGYVEAVMNAVRRHLTPDQYVVTSFRESILAQVREHAPDAQTGLLLAPRPHRDLEQRLQHAGASFLAPHISLTRTGLFSWAAERGLALWVWTVNDRRLLRAALNHPRVAAVITDEPERALVLSRVVDTVDSRR
ncbi:MAG TPA: glycerophosphodiester phosphodiesterase [Solirubrobacteraceae bacterium]|nr:glycerophosphodiester phosphodiesterase [Solirubrobacteraceae bacterium]